MAISPPFHIQTQVLGLILGLPDELFKLARCESSFNIWAWNKEDPNGGSRGLFQYQESTFYYYAKEYGIENPDIWNPEQQIQLTTYLFSENKQYLWTCAKKLNLLP